MSCTEQFENVGSFEDECRDLCGERDTRAWGSQKSIQSDPSYTLYQKIGQHVASMQVLPRE